MISTSDVKDLFFTLSVAMRSASSGVAAITCCSQTARYSVRVFHVVPLELAVDVFFTLLSPVYGTAT